MGKFARFLKELVHRVIVTVGALSMALAFFLVLPLMETITKPPETDLIVSSVDTANLPPPPPPPPEEEKKPEPEKEKEPPKLAEEAPPLDLEQLSLALNPGLIGGDSLGGDFAVKLNLAGAGGSSGDVDTLFSLSDLDKKPRIIYQPSPSLTPQVRQKAPGTVHIIFMVDQSGKVENPIVQNSTDPVFEAPALAAIKQWRFEPGNRNGQPVKFRMRVPIIFPKAQ
jgi:protein TonB